MELPRLYSDLAHLWPLMSPPEDYADEAELVRGVLQEHLAVSPGVRQSILELGAGGGHTLHHLSNSYDCTAVDLSEPMLDNCRQLNPQVRCVAGDMRSVRLDQTFDAVLIHDAIDYMTSEADVCKALQTAAAHLEPGGVLIVAPTYTLETFSDHETEHDFNADGEIELTYFSYAHDPDPNDSTFELILVYLIRDAQTRQVQVIEDRHVCGLFGADHWQGMIRDAGFDIKPGQDVDTAAGPWAMFVGVKG